MFSHTSMSGTEKMKSSVLCCLMAVYSSRTQRILLISETVTAEKQMTEKLALSQLIML